MMKQRQGDPEGLERKTDLPDASGASISHPFLTLAIDDDPGILKFYEAVLAEKGVRVEGMLAPDRVLETIDALDPDLILLDFTLPGVDGMEVLNQIREHNAFARVVMITGNYSIETAVKAIQQGAADYVCKPITPEKLWDLVEDTKRLQVMEARAAGLEKEAIEVFNLEGMIGKEPSMRELFDLVRRVAPHLRTALITGETGTGKELVALALHNLSPRAKQRFSVFNCGALVESLAESQLFGHRKGSFTGALNDQPGLFEWANGGTVFLDEIGDLPPPTQSKLLRVLETGEIQKLGSPEPSHVDVQVIAATSRELSEEIKSGRFRPDLWYRLNMVQIHVPPLRERREDILLLASHFISTFSAKFSKDVRGASRKVETLLLNYSWPGNVRELLNTIGRAVMLTQNKALDEEDLPAALRESPRRPMEWLANQEKEAIESALAESKGKVAGPFGAAAKLGLHPNTLESKIKSLGISKNRFRTP